MTFLYVRCQHTLCDTVGSFLFYLMLRRPPRSTLFPTRRSSDLVEILVAVFIYRPGVHAEFKQMPHALRISDACELREQFASLRHKFANQLRPAFRNGPHARRIVSRTSSNQSFNAGKLDGNASTFEQLKHIAAPSSRGHGNCR